MKKLAFTTAIALALATAAYAADRGGKGSGPGMGGGGGGPGLSAQGPGPGSAGPSGARGPSGFSNSMAPSKGPSQSLYNHAQTNMNSYKQGGPNFDKDRRFSDRDNNRHLYNSADRNHDFDRDHRGRDFDRDHRGVVSGSFFEHGRHFRFRRFFHGEWVFLSDWDDCTAWAWVHVAPGAWAWRPVDICVG